MNQKIESPAELHADHRYWQTDISIWQFDIQEWRKEHAAALKMLQEITDMIQLHDKTLNEHTESVAKIESGLEFHEKNLADSLRGGADSDVEDALVVRHNGEAAKFSRQREAHERIKKHHHVAMAHVASLKRTLEAAM